MKISPASLPLRWCHLAQPCAVHNPSSGARPPAPGEGEWRPGAPWPSDLVTLCQQRPLGDASVPKLFLDRQLGRFTHPKARLGLSRWSQGCSVSVLGGAGNSVRTPRLAAGLGHGCLQAQNETGGWNRSRQSSSSAAGRGCAAAQRYQSLPLKQGPSMPLGQDVPFGLEMG